MGSICLDVRGPLSDGGHFIQMHIVPPEGEDQFMRLVRKRFAEAIGRACIAAYGDESEIAGFSVTVEGLEDE